MMAQLTTKNIALLMSILILTYALYVPKSCVAPRRGGAARAVALRDVVRPLDAASGGDGLARDGVEQVRQAEVALFGFDAMLLVIVAWGPPTGPA